MSKLTVLALGAVVFSAFVLLPKLAQAAPGDHKDDLLNFDVEATATGEWQMHDEWNSLQDKVTITLTEHTVYRIAKWDEDGVELELVSGRYRVGVEGSGSTTNEPPFDHWTYLPGTQPTFAQSMVSIDPTGKQNLVTVWADWTGVPQIKITPEDPILGGWAAGVAQAAVLEAAGQDDFRKQMELSFPLTEKRVSLGGEATHTLKQASEDGTSTGTGTLQVHWRVNFGPVSPCEAVIIPRGNCRSWLPVAGGRPGQPGNQIAFDVELRDPKTGKPPDQTTASFECQLLDVSKYPGSCLNSPWTDADPDLQLLKGDNPRLADLAADGHMGQSPEGLTSLAVSVSCFDGGAHGRLQVLAHLNNGDTITALLEENGKEVGEDVMLPYDDDGNFIADAWEEQNGVTGKSPDEDDDQEPAGNHFNGDGLTIWEEYRGFLEDGKPFRTDPHKKDLFICDTMGGRVKTAIDRLAALTKLVVHSHLTRDELDLSRVINRNHEEGPHVVDQHGLLTWASTGRDSCSAVGGPGPPRTCTEVRLETTTPDTQRGQGADGPQTYPEFVPTVVHELLHACNVWHHGSKDRDVWWHAETVAGKTEIYEYAKRADVGHPERGLMVYVYHESGSECVATKPYWATPHLWALGVKQGQHSGYEDCVMRYDRAEAYTSFFEQTRYLVPVGEPVGQNLCTSPAGTGVNAPDHKPVSRYGGAAEGRGDCTEEICVNDRYEPLPGGP